MGKKKYFLINEQGFSLIELLVVISIIGLLSSLAVVSLNGARQKARDAVRKADMAQLRTALNMYYDDHPTTGYPVCNAKDTDPNAERVICYSGDGVVTAGNGLSLQEALIDNAQKPYIGSLPKDPINPTNSLTVNLTYFLGYDAPTAQEYKIFCNLESGGNCDVAGF